MNRKEKLEGLVRVALRLVLLMILSIFNKLLHKYLIFTSKHVGNLQRNTYRNQLLYYR
jgi:hypothetical protein